MIVTIIGARPQFVEAAALSRILSEVSIKENMKHIGQHYDAKMSDVFFNELGLRVVDKNLHIGSGNHGYQIGNIMIAIEDYLLSQEENIDGLLVYGDTNSNLEGTIVASKQHIPILHVKAVLRCFNRKMPEEVNCVLTDHISSFLFCSSIEVVKLFLNLTKDENFINIS